MNASLALGDRNTLNAVNAGLPPHDAKDSVALHLEDDFLDSIERAFGERHDLDFPSSALCKARVQPEEVGGKDRGFVASGSATDFDDCGPVIEWIVGNERR